MTLHIPIPADIDEALVRRLDQDAREAIAVRLYREGKLSHGQFAKYLSVDRGRVDEILGRHGVADEFTAEEIAEQGRTLSQLRAAGPASG
jgi:predicted HTH domain antitoxin